MKTIEMGRREWLAQATKLATGGALGLSAVGGAGLTAPATATQGGAHIDRRGPFEGGDPWNFEWRELNGQRTFWARLERVRGYEVDLIREGQRITVDARVFAELDQHRIEWFQTRGSIHQWPIPEDARERVGDLLSLEYRRFPDDGGANGLRSWLHRWKSPGRLRFLLHVPKEARAGRPCPLLVWFHGNGGRGSDNLRQLTDGGAVVRRLFSEEWQGRLPSFIMVPQSDPQDNNRNVWMNHEAAIPHRALLMTVQCIDVLRATLWPNIQNRKMWVGGLSSGGVGAMEALSKFPGRFAAGVPIACSYEPWRFHRGSAVPLWMIVNQQDRAVSMREIDALVAHFRDLRVEVKVTRYSGAGHDAWNRALSDMDFRNWLAARELRQDHYPSDIRHHVKD